jgi:hypothetical protein
MIECGQARMIPLRSEGENARPSQANAKPTGKKSKHQTSKREGNEKQVNKNSELKKSNQNVREWTWGDD